MFGHYLAYFVIIHLAQYDRGGQCSAVIGNSLGGLFFTANMVIGVRIGNGNRRGCRAGGGIMLPGSGGQFVSDVVIRIGYFVIIVVIKRPAQVMLLVALAYAAPVVIIMHAPKRIEIIQGVGYAGS